MMYYAEVQLEYKHGPPPSPISHGEEISSESSSSSFLSSVDSNIAKADNREFVSWTVKSDSFRFLAKDMID